LSDTDLYVTDWSSKKTPVSPSGQTKNSFPAPLAWAEIVLIVFASTLWIETKKLFGWIAGRPNTGT